MTTVPAPAPGAAPIGRLVTVGGRARCSITGIAGDLAGGLHACVVHGPLVRVLLGLPGSALVAVTAVVTVGRNGRPPVPCAKPDPVGGAGRPPPIERRQVMGRTSVLCRTAARYGLYAVLGGWFSVSLLGQDPLRRHDRIRRFDRFDLVVPDWRFFAPNPGIHDFHLLYRDELTDGTCTGWAEVSRIEERRLRQIVWHPHRRAEKVLFDVVSELLRSVGESGNERAVLLSVPYLTLLNHVSGPQRGHRPEAVRTQFLLAVSAGHDNDEDPTMLFLSEWHPLADDGARTRPVAS